MSHWIIGIGGILLIAGLFVWLAWYLDPNGRG